MNYTVDYNKEKRNTPNDRDVFFERRRAKANLSTNRILEKHQSNLLELTKDVEHKPKLHQVEITFYT